MINYNGISDSIVWCTVIGGVGVSIARRSTYLCGAAFAFMALSSLRLFQNTLNGPLLTNVSTQLINIASLSAMVSLLLTLFIAQAFSENFWLSFFRGIALLNATLIIGYKLFHVHDVPWGLLLNASMSGCFGASLFFLFMPQENWKRGFILLSVIMCGRSLPVAVLFSGWAAQCIVEDGIGLSLFILAGGALTGYVIKGPAFLNTNGRSQIWSTALQYFKDYVSPIYGAGLGSFHVVGPFISSQSHLDAVFHWLHSDWAQIGFETGAIGLGLVVAMYGHALYKARHAPQMFGALVAFAVFGMANMPLRYPLVGVYAAVLMRWVFEQI